MRAIDHPLSFEPGPLIHAAIRPFVEAAAVHLAKAEVAAVFLPVEHPERPEAVFQVVDELALVEVAVAVHVAGSACDLASGEVPHEESPVVPDVEDAALPALRLLAVLALDFAAVFLRPRAEFAGRALALGRVSTEVEPFPAPFVRVLGLFRRKDYLLV